MIKCFYRPEFCKAYKRLCKKYHSLPKDFEVFLKAVQVNPRGYEPNTVLIGGLGEDVILPIYKVRKFALSCMKESNSGIRIVYAYDAKLEQIELVEFIEVYHKNTQENHNEALLKKIYENKKTLPSEGSSQEL